MKKKNSMQKVYVRYPMSIVQFIRRDLYNWYTRSADGYYQVYNVPSTERDRRDTSLKMKTGIIDSLGNIVIPIQYLDIQKVKDVFVVIEKAGASNWGLIDKTGKYLLPPIFENFNIEDSLIYFFKFDKYAAVFNVNTNKSEDLPKHEPPRI